MNWVWHNPKLLHNIKKCEAEYLFKFDPQRGLAIHLDRFDPGFDKTPLFQRKL